MPKKVSPLVLAARKGQEQKVRDLLALQKDCTSKQVNAALKNAALLGHHNIVRILIQTRENADGVREDSLIWTEVKGRSLISAANNGHTETVRVLLEHKANVHADVFGIPDAPLRQAAFHGSTEIVRLLLENKAYVNARGMDGQPDDALYWAACNSDKDTETVCVLLQYKALIENLPSCFVEERFGFTQKNVIDNVSLAMRIGNQFRRLPRQFVQFETARTKYVNAIHKTAAICCRELCHLILLYV